MRIQNFRRWSALVLLGSLGLSFLAGCVRKNQTVAVKPQKIELVFYSLFDDEDVYQPIIQKYETLHPNITITYRKFTDPVQYMNLIINELAEGQGPDIFAAPNYWFLRNVKKLSPMPVQTFSPQQFQQTFVSVANNDLIQKDPNDGQNKVYGIPLYVDTLALYYNKSDYDDAIPGQGRPATTWSGLEDDVYKLSKTDNSFARFNLAGIAMGRSDNISRAIDILYMLMLQYKTVFYNSDFSKTAFADQQITDSTGLLINPAAEALRLYTSFALPANKNYSWNEYLADPTSPVKELQTFAEGKVAMIFGYSYLYPQILAEINDLKGKGVQTIDPKDVQVTVAPQVNDPATSTEARVAYANYYAETVARTSAHPAEAWDFLMFLSSKANLQYYNTQTHNPTSRLDLIDSQLQDPIYGVFAQQTGFAKSIPEYDDASYNQIFSDAITSVLATSTPEDAIRTAAGAIDALIPSTGMIPTSNTNGTGSTSTQQSS